VVLDPYRPGTSNRPSLCAARRACTTYAERSISTLLRPIFVARRQRQGRCPARHHPAGLAGQLGSHVRRVLPGYWSDEGGRSGRYRLSPGKIAPPPHLTRRQSVQAADMSIEWADASEGLGVVWPFVHAPQSPGLPRCWSGIGPPPRFCRKATDFRTIGVVWDFRHTNTEAAALIGSRSTTNEAGRSTLGVHRTIFFQHLDHKARGDGAGRPVRQCPLRAMKGHSQCRPLGST